MQLRKAMAVPVVDLRNDEDVERVRRRRREWSKPRLLVVLQRWSDRYDFMNAHLNGLARSKLLVDPNLQSKDSLTVDKLSLSDPLSVRMRTLQTVALLLILRAFRGLLWQVCGRHCQGSPR